MADERNQALAKPASDERLIFIDINAECDVTTDDQPAWVDAAANRLERHERDELAAGKQAYVFVTNTSYHRALNDPSRAWALPFGLGIPDFRRLEDHLPSSGRDQTTTTQ